VYPVAQRLSYFDAAARNALSPKYDQPLTTLLLELLSLLPQIFSTFNVPPSADPPPAILKRPLPYIWAPKFVEGEKEPCLALSDFDALKQVARREERRQEARGEEGSQEEEV